MARYDDRRDTTFLTLWTLSVIATTTLFLVYLAVRVRGVELGYELGDAQGELSRLREVERVLELELSAHENPERVDFVARSLFGMDQPEPERIHFSGRMPEPDAEGEEDRVADRSDQGPPRGAGESP